MKSNHLTLTKFISALLLLGISMECSTALAQQRTPAPRRTRPAARVQAPAEISTGDPLFPGDDDLSDIVVPLNPPAPVVAPPAASPSEARPSQFRMHEAPRADILSHTNQTRETRVSTERDATNRRQNVSFANEQVAGALNFLRAPVIPQRLGERCIDQHLSVLNGAVTHSESTRTAGQYEIDAMLTNGELNTVTGPDGVVRDNMSVADYWRERGRLNRLGRGSEQIEAAQVSGSSTEADAEAQEQPTVTIVNERSEVQLNQDRAAVVDAFIATLRCEIPCLSQKDATYLANQCYRVGDRIPANPNARAVRDLFESLPSCSNEQLRAAALRGEYEFSQPDSNGQCVKGIQFHQFSAFSGIDIALIMDNSGSMATLGQEVVRDVFPQLLNQVRNLSPSARMIMMTHVPSTTSTRVLDVNSDSFLTDAEQIRQSYVAASTPEFVNERLFDAAQMNLTGAAHARPRADLLTIFLTDEHDFSAMDGLQFVKTMQDLTTGPFTVLATHRDGDFDAHLGEAISITHGAYLNLSARDLGQKLDEYISEYIHPTRPRELTIEDAMGSVLQVNVNGVALPTDKYVVVGDHTVNILPDALTPGVPTVIDVFFVPEGLTITGNNDQSAATTTPAPALSSMLDRAMGDPNRFGPTPEDRLPSQQILDLMDQVLRHPAQPAAPTTGATTPLSPRVATPPAAPAQPAAQRPTATQPHANAPVAAPRASAPASTRRTVTPSRR